MTPEERRARVEHVAERAELGMLAEPAYDRKQWRAQREVREPFDRKSGSRVSPSDTARGRTG